MKLRHLLPKTPPKKLKETGENFSDYIQKMRKVISNGRLDLTGHQAKAIIDENAPFEWIPTSPNGKAVILTHGLYDSPFSMRDVAQHYLKQGYLVRAILLPGHGTVPGDLLRVNVEDWINTLRFAIDQTAPLVESLYLVGFSLGATLSIILHQHSSKIAAVIGLAPAIRPKHPFSHITRFHKLFTWISEKAKFYHRNRALVSHVKYFSTPYNAAKNSIKAMSQARRMDVTVPMFMAISVDDETIAADSVVRYFERQAIDNNRMIIYTNDACPSNDARVICRSSAYPDENIIDFSHCCIPISPENPFLGRNGNFVDFVHYETTQKPNITTLKLGATSPYNLSHYILQRLNYNPNYYQMMQDIDRFIETT